MLKRFDKIDTNKIKGQLILLDIDGTLTNDRNKEVPEEMIKRVSELKEENEIYLCSNCNIHERNQKVAETTKVKYLKTNTLKPNPQILELIKNEKQLPLMVIGDKCWPDGIFAKKIGAKFIKVKRIKSENDRLIVKISYLIDDILNKLICH